MDQIDYHRQDILRIAMRWQECGVEIFHVDAYNFGKSLRPLLRNESADSMDRFINMLKLYETYRADSRRVMRPVYNNRYGYIKELVHKNVNYYLELFQDTSEVVNLVYKQMKAHLKAMKRKPGWQRAMWDAGIWDDDKELL